MPRKRNSLAMALSALALASAATLVWTAPALADESPAADARPALALMGTVPIYWGESDGFDDLLTGAGQAHWARGVLEADFALAPLDYLSAEALAGHSYLLMAQPRGLSGEENVALDAWVRAGGLLLLFVDPLMTGESRFSLGDRRRPQDVALLSPILGHWGLELTFDAEQAFGLTQVDHFGDVIPVNMRGVLQPAGETQDCAIPGDGLLAHCAIGAGQVLVLADAALLDLDGPYPGAQGALDRLVAHIFAAARGESAGNAPLAADLDVETADLMPNFASPAVPDAGAVVH